MRIKHRYCGLRQVLCLAALLTISNRSWASPESSVIGHLTGPNGKPIVGASVELINRINGFSAFCVTDPEGTFSFFNVPFNPHYTLSANLRGSCLLSKSLEVSSATPGELTIRLELERKAVTGPLGPFDPQGLTPIDIQGNPGQVTSGTAFNPAMSVIPEARYYNDSRQGDAAKLLGQADGFPNSFEGDKQGFNLGETELAFSASADPYFDTWAVLAVAPDSIEVEEAYIQTRRLPAGLQLRAGKFKSGIGYINKQHAHQWDFEDQALPYTMLFGEVLGEVGVQLNWLPPLPFYMLVGIEALQGENSGVANYIGQDDTHPFFGRKSGPRLFTGFIKVSPDLGYSNALQGGLFCGRANFHQEDFDRATVSGTVTEALQGTAKFFGTDWVFKYSSPHQYGRGNLTIQGEYVYRLKDLDVIAVINDPALLGPNPAPAGGSPGRRKFRQDGFYIQAVYGFAARWTAGVRYDTVGLTNRVELSDLGRLNFGTTRRWSADITTNFTEFSRFRLQYNHLEIPIGGRSENVNEVFLQYQFSLGVHGAHKF